MAKFLFANDAATTLAGPIASNSTTANVAAGSGAQFPSPAAGQQFAITFTPAGDTTNTVYEIAYVTARSGDVLTLLRAQEGTAARAWSAGDSVQDRFTAGSAAVMVQEAELQQQPGNYAVATGTANAQVIALTPAPASLALITGSPIRFKSVGANTGAVTLQIVGAGTATIVNPDGLQLGAGQLQSAHVFEVVYNGSSFEMVGNPYAVLFRANGWSGTQNFTQPTTHTQINAAAIGVTGLVNAGTISSAGSISASSTIAASGPITSAQSIVANGGPLRASVGALGSGDIGRATLLGDFNHEFLGNDDFFYQQLPTGAIIQSYHGVTNTGIDPVLFQLAFPNVCNQIIAMEAAPQGWGSPPIMRPTIFGIQQLTNAGFVLYCTKWDQGAGQWALGNGVSYRYIAIGN